MISDFIHHNKRLPLDLDDDRESLATGLLRVTTEMAVSQERIPSEMLEWVEKNYFSNHSTFFIFFIFSFFFSLFLFHFFFFIQFFLFYSTFFFFFLHFFLFILFFFSFHLFSFSSHPHHSISPFLFLFSFLSHKSFPFSFLFHKSFLFSFLFQKSFPFSFLFHKSFLFSFLFHKSFLFSFLFHKSFQFFIFPIQLIPIFFTSPFHFCFSYFHFSFKIKPPLLPHIFFVFIFIFSFKFLFCLSRKLPPSPFQLLIQFYLPLASVTKHKVPCVPLWEPCCLRKSSRCLFINSIMPSIMIINNSVNFDGYKLIYFNNKSNS